MNETKTAEVQHLHEIEELHQQLVHLEQRIAESTQREEEFRKERDFSSAVLSIIDALVVVLNRDGRIVRWNHACQQRFGYPFDEVQGKVFWEVFLIPEEIESVKAVFADLSSGNFPNRHENYWLTKDGERRLISWSNTALLDDSGSVEYVIGTGVDITDRKQAETDLQQAHDELEQHVQERTRELTRTNEALQQEKIRFQMFMDHNPAVIYIKDETGWHIYCNKTLQESFDISWEQFIGTTSYDFFSNEAAARLEAEDLLVRTQNVTRDLGEWSDTFNGEIRWWTEVKFPLPIDAETTLVGGIGVNITVLKQAEEKVQERLSFEQLISRLSATFIASPAHEIDKLIHEALQMLGEFLGMDRAGLGQFNAERTELRHTHFWYNAESETAESIGTVNLVDHMPWVVENILRREPIILRRFTDIPEEAINERAHGLNLGIRSLLIIPLVAEDMVIGFIGLDSLWEEKHWSDELIQQLSLASEIFTNALTRQQAEQKLQRAFEEITALKDRLEQENVHLREQIELKHRHTDIIGESEIMRSVLKQIEQVAETDSTVLITGETGTGKELIARTIHKLSARKDRPMVTVNCAALPSTLIENELFGREKGAYTGATSRQIGRFEIANGSTIFLDEIGELPLELQVKLLRVLQEGQLERLGSTGTITVDVRVIAATNKDLDQEIQTGRFREDLFYRLSVFPTVLPPLRKRREDIPLLVWTFIEEFNKRMGKSIDRVSGRSMTALQQYAWPGNIRELRNVIEHAMIVSTDNTLCFRLPKFKQTSSTQPLTLEEVERRHILDVLEQTGWRIKGPQGTAELLGLKRSTLQSRMKKLGIHRPNQHSDLLS